MIVKLLKGLAWLSAAALLVAIIYFGLEVDKQVNQLAYEIQQCNTLTDASLKLADMDKENKFFTYHWELEYKLPEGSLWKITLGIGPIVKTADIKETYKDYKIVISSKEEFSKAEELLKENEISFSTGRE